jgi:hypothetical protein
MMMVEQVQQRVLRVQRVLEQVAQVTGSKYLNTVRNRIVLFSFEQQVSKESMRMKTNK